MKKIVALLCLTSSALPLLAGQIIYVNQNAPASSAHTGVSWANAYTSLQTAISNANPTTNNAVEIWVAPGLYRPTEGTNRNAAFVMKTNLRILGGFAGTETSADTPRLFSNIGRTILSGDIGVRQ